ncbi:MAG: hypothetical protein ABIA11_01750 [Patescibacteria group bacterium]
MMIKFSITQLETARRNPVVFARNLSSKNSLGGFSYSRFAAWQNAIFYWHKTDDQSQARDYLSNAMQKFLSVLRSGHQLAQYVHKFDSYIRSHKDLGFSFVEARKRISLPINEDVTLTGQIPIINLNGKLGYSIIFFVKEGTGWDGQLKFPLLQSFFANTIFGCELSEIEVGIFSFDKERHFSKTYNEEEVDTCLKEIYEIGRKIRKTLK